LPPCLGGACPVWSKYYGFLERLQVPFVAIF
jgi:hypothetical protein